MRVALRVDLEEFAHHRGDRRIMRRNGVDQVGLVLGQVARLVLGDGAAGGQQAGGKERGGGDQGQQGTSKHEIVLVRSV